MKGIIEYIKSKKVIEFLNNKGFYIVLLLCVVTVTMTAYIVTKRNLSSYMEDLKFNQLTEELAQSETSTTTGEVDTKEDVVAYAPKPIVENKKEITSNKMNADKPIVSNNETYTDNKTNSNKVSIPKIEMENPVIGKISKAFSKDTLIYSSTLDQWTTHEGIDVLGERGTPVKCVADGVVEDVIIDGLKGITIIIDHGNDLKSVYCNLSTDTMVQKGKALKKGDVISGVGSTALFESSDNSHLHFEVIKDGKRVNPSEYIK